MKFFLLFFFSFLRSLQIHGANIGVCVTGQTSRWQPQLLFDGLIRPNIEFSNRFYLFFNIQKATVFNTDIANTFAPGALSKLNDSEVLRFVRALYEGPQVEVASLKFPSSISREELLQTFHVNDLDRISQYVGVQHTILNMYAHQVNCIRQIVQFEKEHSMKLDYIIWTREDTLFFRPLQLSKILPQLRKDTRDFRNSSSCDILFKRCRNFWGFNMRLYILTREVGLKFLGNRFSFYRYLYSINKTIENPERFELIEASALNFIGCARSVEYFPVTAVRHYQNGQMCFVWFEVDRCVPQSYQEFAKDHLCLEVRRRSYLDQMYSEFPELLQPDFFTGVGNVSLTEEDKKFRSNINFRTMSNYDWKPFQAKRVTELLENNKKIAVGLQRLSLIPGFVDATWVDRDF
jgi:hypothetical protein